MKTPNTSPKKLVVKHNVVTTKHLGPKKKSKTLSKVHILKIKTQQRSTRIKIRTYSEPIVSQTPLQKISLPQKSFANSKIMFFAKAGSTVLLSALLVAGVVSAAGLIRTYNPGETLDPTCLPGEANCTVSSPVTSLGPIGQGQTGTSQLLASSTSGTDFSITSFGNTHTFNIPTASTLNRGLLSATDWTTFNLKQSLLSFAYPLINSANTISLAFGTTTNNVWSGTNTFNGTLAFANFDATSATATSTVGTGGFAVGGSQFVIQNSGGNIGIGTTGPNGILDVATVGNALRLRSGDIATASNNYNQILLSYNGGLNYTHSIKTRHDSGVQAGNAIDFYLWNNGVDAAGTIGTKQVMSLLGNGNVGIGTTSPGAGLHVSNSGAYQVIYQSTGTIDGTTAGFALKTSSGSPWEIHFQTNQGKGWFEMVNSVGGVQRRWDGVNDLFANNGILGWSSESNFATPASGARDIGLARVSAGKLEVNTGTAGSLGTLIAGNVGIGTSSPASALDVNGNINGSSYFIQPSIIGSEQAGLIADGENRNTVDIGINKAQFGGRNSSDIGSIMRFDARGGHPLFSVIYDEPGHTGGGGDEDFPLQMTSAGNLLVGNGWGADNNTGTGNGQDLQVHGDSYFGGKVGIGTTSPTYSLTVAPNGGTALQTMLVQDATPVTGKTSFVLRSGAGQGTTWDPFSIQDSTGSNTFFRVTAGGSIGSAGGIIQTSGAAISWTSGNMYVSPDVGLSRLSAGKLAVGNGTVGDMSGTLIAGNVGIGMTAPAANLQVSGTNVTDGSGNPGNVFIGTSNSQGADIGGSLSLGGYENTGLLYHFATIAGRKLNSTAGDYSGYLTFSTRNNGSVPAERVRIDNNGNVGIGTTSPWGQLSVNPNGVTGPEFVIGSSTKTDFIVTNNGNVGIGKNAPGYPLDVAGYVRTDSGVIFGPNGDGNGALVFANGNQMYGGGDYALTSYGSGSSIFSLTNRSQSGIGTAYEQLNFSKADPNATNNYPGASIRTTFTASTVGTMTGELSFATNNASTLATERMRITSTGNVGIGTTGPANTLDVASSAGGGGINISRVANVGDGSQVGLFNFYAPNASSHARDWAGMTVNAVTSAEGTESGNLTFSTQVAGVYTPVMTLNSGNVGIGTTSPWTKLSVNGTAAFSGLTSGNTGYYLCLNTSTYQMSTSTTACGASSARYKENIQTLSDSRGLSQVMSMRPVTFNYKTEMNVVGPQIGFVAEEMFNIIPEAVGVDAQGLPSNIDYGKVTPVLVKAIQELNLNVRELVETSTAEATSTSSVSFASSFFSNLFARVTTWLADSANGIVRIFAKEVNTGVLCVSDESGAKTCIDKSQLDTLIAKVGGVGTGSGAVAPQDVLNGKTISATGSPVITLVGNNPAEIAGGSAYVDLGATVVDTNPDGTVNNNLGLHFSVDGVSMSEVSLDTSVSSSSPQATTTHTVVYSAVNGAGNWGYATRTVNILP